MAWRHWVWACGNEVTGGRERILMCSCLSADICDPIIAKCPALGRLASAVWHFLESSLVYPTANGKGSLHGDSCISESPMCLEGLRKGNLPERPGRQKVHGFLGIQQCHVEHVGVGFNQFLRSHQQLRPELFVAAHSSRNRG